MQRTGFAKKIFRANEYLSAIIAYKRNIQVVFDNTKGQYLNRKYGKLFKLKKTNFLKKRNFLKKSIFHQTYQFFNCCKELFRVVAKNLINLSIKCCLLEIKLTNKRK